MVRAVVAVGEEALGDRHPDAVREALPEWPRRRLDSGGVPVLGMSRRAGAPLPELLEVGERDVVAREVERRVLEDAGVPGGEDEAVSSRPVRIGRVVPHHVAVEQIRQRREGHRRPRVTGVRLLHCVHRECADRVDRFRAGVRGHCSASISPADCGRVYPTEPCPS